MKKPLEQFIEERIVLAKTEERYCSTKQLMMEAVQQYRIIHLSRKKRREIEILIKKIKERVKKRLNRKRKATQDTAMKLDVPERMIERWSNTGKLQLENKNKVERIVHIVRERDFYRLTKMKSEEIPEDDHEPLWGK